MNHEPILHDVPEFPADSRGTAPLSMNDFSHLRPLLVAIVGPSGSGKSWLSGELRLRLGKECDSLSLDSYYKDRSHLPAARRSCVNFDHPRSIDWPLVESALVDARNGRSFSAPVYNFAEHVRTPTVERRRPCPILLVDGLWLLWRANLRRLFDLSVFVRCETATCLRRRLERDKLERKRDADSIRRQFREQVAPMATRYVLPQERWADMVVHSPLSGEIIDAIATRIRLLMSGNRRS